MFAQQAETDHPSESADSPKLELKTQQLIKDDLNFLLPLLKEYPKCYWIWKYRLWLLEQAETLLSQPQAIEFWKQELALASHHLTRDERNFHGWNYRGRVVSHLERLGGASLADSEFTYSTSMIQMALQNFSALHYRSKLIPRLLDERHADDQARRQMLDSELDLMHNALIDPYNQSAWFYHQFLMSSLQPNCPREAAIALDLDKDARLAYYEQEIEFLEEMLEDFDDCKWIYEALVRYRVECKAVTGQGLEVYSGKLRHWLAELGRLDTLRAGRWADLQKELHL